MQVQNGRTMSADHTRWLSQSEAAPRAREILERKIQDGRKSALALFERINTEAPQDSIAKGSALRFGTHVFETIERLHGGEPKPELVMGYGDTGARIHKHALGQLASKAGVPGAYAAEMAQGELWQRKLIAGVLNEHYHQGNPNGRYLVRNVKGEVRGFLSDKYRRLDSRPLVEAFAEECGKVGAVPVDGIWSDTRVSLRALLPSVFEPVSGEVIALGVEWGNSDFGAAMHAVRAFILRVWCLNGATMENALAQVHLGRGISDDIELSAQTYRLDTKASISALRDVVGNVLAPQKVAALCAGIQQAHENKVDWKNVKAGLAKSLLKGEMAAAEAAFNSPDVVNLPAGNTMWRVSNALSWIAGSTEDADRKLELQRLAGQVIDDRKDVAMREAA